MTSDVELLELVKELTKDLVIKTKVEKVNAPKHGSSCGEEFEIIMYWNKYKNDWVYSKESVIEDHLIIKLKPFIKL